MLHLSDFFQQLLVIYFLFMIHNYFMYYFIGVIVLHIYVIEHEWIWTIFLKVFWSAIKSPYNCQIYWWAINKLTAFFILDILNDYLINFVLNFLLFELEMFSIFFNLDILPNNKSFVAGLSFSFDIRPKNRK